MRISATLTALTLAISGVTASAAESESYGGFLGMTGSYIQTSDIDETDFAAKIVFGPNITENLSLEFGLMDFGEMSYKDPSPILFEDDPTIAPLLSGASQGDLDRNSNDNGVPGETIYTGPESYQARSILVNLRYNFEYTETLDFFIKGGASAWIADVEKTRITYYGDGTYGVKEDAGKNETSGVELITGAGLLWNPWAGLNVRAEIESTSLDSFYIEPTSFFLYSLGLQYEF